jgi:AcrR family transcriptional regulator
MVLRPTPRALVKKRKPARGRVFLRGVDDTSAQLVAAARDVFLESGPAHFSLREVARRVGVSAAAVYRHFEDKEALVFAACTQGFQVFSSYLVRALSESSPRARLLATGEQYRLFGLENPLDYRFIFMSSADELGLAEKHQERRATSPMLPQDSTFRFLVDRIQECMTAGVLASADAESTAVLIWAHVHGLVSLRLSNHLGPLGDDQAFAAFYRASVERLLRSLAE